MLINIKAVPGASKTEIAEYQTDAAGNGFFRIRIAAAPEDGKANAELVSFIAKKLKVPKKDIQIVSGQKSRNKILSVPDGGLESLLRME
ncbi:MAG: DUF167 domain-containing protein [Spirochaetaceae bacterium]|nr:DUF167 domain-containing protein [Spirochaetaceae bacterium]